MSKLRGSHQHQPAPFLFLRTPIFPWKQWGSPLGKSESQHLDQAIAYASPDLYSALGEQKEGKRKSKTGIRSPLWHYENRAHFRPTPFGLFSCFSLVDWSRKDESILLSSHPRYHAQETLVREGRQRESMTLSAGGRWQTNPSIYVQGAQIRYMHYQYHKEKDQRLYGLRSLSFLPWLETFLRRWAGKIFRLDSALNYLSKDLGFTPEESMAVMENLFGEGLILPWQALSITGPASLSVHEDIDSLNKAWPPKKSSRENPYINAQRMLISGGLLGDYASDLQECLNLIHRWKPFCPPPAIRAFAREFQRKFEQNALPLMDALDPISGIPYPPAGPLPAPHELDSRIRSFLIRRWAESRLSGKPLRIDAEDMDSLNLDSRPCAPLPSSISVLFRVHDQEIYWETGGGSHGTALLGRFTPFDTSLWKACRQVAESESRSLPHILLADLVQVQDYHLANIERRQPLYPYEICFHEGGGLARENQIPVNDLMISLVQGKLIIWSRRHRKQVLARLNSAFNPAWSSLPPFRLLADLSGAYYQTDLRWSLEEYLPGLDYYPRVYLGKVLVGRETWILRRESPHKPLTGESLLAQIESGPGQKRPHWVSLDHWDRQLVFSLRDPRDLDQLVHELRDRQTAILREWIPPKAGLVQDEKGRDYSHQFVALFQNTQTQPIVEFSPPPLRTGWDQRRWEQKKAAEWTYYKIYLPSGQISRFLAEKIGPWIQSLEKGLPHLRWFFVRYRDPEPHIRLRFQHKDLRELRRIEQGISLLRKWEREGEIRRFEIRPYQPEWVRYPPFLIQECESLFHASSRFVLGLLTQQGEEALSLEQPLALWKPLDGLFQGLGWPWEKRSQFFQSLFQSMVLTEQMDPSALKKLKSTYWRAGDSWKKRDWESSPVPSDWTYALMPMEENGRSLAQRIQNLPETRKDTLIADLVHMHLNRHLELGSRDQEILVYYLIWKKYRQLVHFRKSAGATHLGLPGSGT